MIPKVRSEIKLKPLKLKSLKINVNSRNSSQLSKIDKIKTTRRSPVNHRDVISPPLGLLNTFHDRPKVAKLQFYKIFGEPRIDSNIKNIFSGAETTR